MDDTIPLERRIVQLERLLLDLTPGGSEYHGSPERCAEWIKARLSSTGKLAAQRNRLRTAADALAEALKPLADKAASYGDDQPDFYETQPEYFSIGELRKAQEAIRQYEATK